MYEDHLGLVGGSDDEYIIGVMSDAGEIGFMLMPKTAVAGIFDIVTKPKKALKWLAKTATAPIKAGVSLTTAPMRAAVDIARGKPVAKTLLRTAVTQPMRDVGTVVRNPIVKMGVKGAAMLFPPATVAVHALSAADKILSAAQGVLPSQKAAHPGVARALQDAAKTTIENTYRLAARGNKDAQRGLKVLVAARAAQKKAQAQAAVPPPASGIPGQQYHGPLVGPDGMVIRGRWVYQGA